MFFSSSTTVSLILILSLALHLSASRKLFENQLDKCCPSGQNLDIKRLENGTIYYDCVPVADETLFGYNIRQSDESQIPVCDNLIANNFPAENHIISTNGCLDTVGDAISSLKCPYQQNIDVHLVYKCCESGYSYDFNERFCVPNERFLENFSQVFGESVVVFKTQVPRCNDDEVFVEYHSTVHDIWFSRSSVTIAPKYRASETLSPRTFCIEGTVNHTTAADTNATRDLESIHVIVRSCRPRENCDRIPCVRRCCENDQMMTRDNNTGHGICAPHAENKNLQPIFHDVGEWTHDVPTPVHISDYGVLHKQPCERFKLDDEDPMDKHFLGHLDGKLYVNNTDEPYDADSYCIEFINARTIKLATFVCFGEEVAKFQYYPYGLTISCIFLAITLIVYLCLPKLLNLHGKTLVCYVISLLTAYIVLATVQFHSNSKLEKCYEAAFLIFFCFLAAFCWQTVMCFDIWRTFGSLRSSFVLRRNKDRRVFIYYSIYAWGVPLLWTAVTILVDQYKLLSYKWSPTMALYGNQCWFSRHHWRGHFLFFLLPSGLHIFLNAVLFVFTSINCSRVKAEIHRMQTASESEVQTRRKTFVANKAMFVFMMNIKLFIVMGVSWIIEIVTTFTHDPHGYMDFADVFNIFQGVLVFFIFVFKRKVLHELQQKLGFKRQKNGMSTPRSTTTTNTVNICLKDKTTVGRHPSNMTLLSSNPNLN